ncbi:MAG: hypothetical protein AB7H71_12465 [Alphaproteobacteria bacterium]
MIRARLYLPPDAWASILTHGSGSGSPISDSSEVAKTPKPESLIVDLALAGLLDDHGRRSTRCRRSGRRLEKYLSARLQCPS